LIVTIGGGFKFFTSAAYHDSTSLSAEFLEHMNSGYKDLDAVLAIDSTDKAESAVPNRSRAGGWKERWDVLVNKFIEEQEKTRRYIMNASDTKVGSTLGEQSLTYYEYKSLRSDNIDVFVVDQPEDHISNARISAKLTEFFNRMRNSKQIILVTHSPLLVVNQDADNVIVLNEDKDTNKLHVQSGCLESEGILEQVAEKMESGTEAVRKRLRVYGETV
jgi:PHD/YefM family antitoxin component YafN of YafNO toxin-antitoxin module